MNNKKWNKDKNVLAEIHPNGQVYECPEELGNNLYASQGDHKTIWGFIAELYHDYDKKYALQQLREELTRGYEYIISQEREKQDRHHDTGLSIQRGKHEGQLFEKFHKEFPDYPYDPLDAVPIPQPGDHLVFPGMTSGKIKEVVWQEIQKDSIKPSMRLHKGQIKDALDAGRFRFELYTPNGKK